MPGAIHDAAVTTQSLGRKFAARFGETPRIYQAPGRVNLIGEHTDYNDGFVMPAAIGFYTRVAIAPRTDRKLVVWSENYSEERVFDLDHLPEVRAGHWSDYVVGVAIMLAHSGMKLGGASVLVDGSVPQGSGLSSSASIEVAIGFALRDLFDTVNPRDDRKALALLCQRAENEFVGARCGIMDQFVSAHGEKGRAILLDCRSLEFRLLPIPDGVALAVCNTMVKHSIAGGEYNKRRAECEEGARAIAKRLPAVKALRDVSFAELQKYGGELPEPVFRRCRHVITENARTLEAAADLEKGDLASFGVRMRESHQSLRDDFEVSCAELDAMVELAGKADGVFGARMTGGGFGGCAIALVRAECADRFHEVVAAGYEKATGKKPEIYICSASEGAGEIQEMEPGRRA